MKKIVLIIGISLLLINYSAAQTSINAAGGDFISEDATLSYSIGQIFYETDILNEGVQLPYNILEMVGIDEVENIFLNILAYPNPTQDFLELRIETDGFDFQNVFYQISDNNGRLLISDKIQDFQTVISMEKFPKGVYLLKVKTKDNVLKTFKVVKN
ncbi:MAG: T9SS type A sorting domain-containing protein [Marinilabiliaceae bacterium]|nr:T9SS type A sorting domain-containing protein [Marinilabiliaceae bacterium]